MMLTPSYIVFVILLLIPIIFCAYDPHRPDRGRRHRCQVDNLRFQRHVDLKRYIGRYVYQRVTPVLSFFPDLKQGRSIAKLVTEDTFTTYAIAMNTDGKCVKNLFICGLVNPPGPLFRWTMMNFPGIPTFDDIYLAETDYVGYLVFYTCLEKAHDGTCAKPWVIVESREEKMTRRQNSAVTRVLRRLCVDESTLVEIRQGPRCPEPENITFRPISQPIEVFFTEEQRLERRKNEVDYWAK